MTDDALIDYETKERRDALAADYAEQFTIELEQMVRASLPITLDNDHYASGTSGMLTALTRLLGMTGVAFAETYGVDRDRMLSALSGMVRDALEKAYAALDKGNAPIGKPN